MNPRELEERIERMIQEHLAACRVAVEVAVERAFVGASEPIRPRRKSARRSKRKPTPKRTPAELTVLRERLYSTVCAMPGETMMALAAHQGNSSKLLRVPMLQLKRAGRVRSVGQRPYTRYFPMVGDTKSDQEVKA